MQKVSLQPLKSENIALDNKFPGESRVNDISNSNEFLDSEKNEDLLKKNSYTISITKCLWDKEICFIITMNKDADS